MSTSLLPSRVARQRGSKGPCPPYYGLGTLSTDVQLMLPYPEGSRVPCMCNQPREFAICKAPVTLRGRVALADSNAAAEQGDISLFVNPMDFSVHLVHMP